MSETVLVAVPSDAPGGLGAQLSAHFGHCAAYTIAKIEDGRIVDSRVMPNPGHEHGDCVDPVRQLAKDGVNVLLAGGMGHRPLMAMHEAGIKVYHCAGPTNVNSALEAFAQGKLEQFGADKLCKGCHGH